MKKLITILFFSLQIVAYSQPYFWNKITGLETVPYDFEVVNDSLILTTYLSGVSCRENYITAYNKQGDSLWTRDNALTIGKYNKGYYTVNTGHDFGDVVHLSFDIKTYNQNNEIQNEYYYENYDSFFEFDYDLYHSSNFLTATDYLGNYLICRHNVFCKLYDLETNAPSHRFVTGDFDSQIRNITFINPEKLFFQTNEALYTADSSLTHFESFNFDSEIVASMYKDDTIYALLSDNLIRLTTSFEIIDTLLTDESIVFNKVIAAQDYIYVQGIKENNVHVIRINKETENEEFVFDNLSTETRFWVSDNQFIFGGKTFTNQSTVYSYNLNTEPKVLDLPDIGIVDFEVSNHRFSHTLAYMHYYKVDVSITVQNNAIDTLRSFELYSYLHGVIFCVSHYIHKSYTDLAIASGEEYTFSITATITESSNRHRDFCFKVFAPNNTIEKYADDNSLCKSILLSVDNSSKTSVVNIYPNPATDQLMIGVETTISTIDITNTAGNQMIHTAIHGNEAVVDVSALQKGLYIITISTPNGVIKEKFVKE